MWTILANIINIMRIAEIVNLSIDLVGNQVTWGNHKDQLREWAEQVTNKMTNIFSFAFAFELILNNQTLYSSLTCFSYRT